MHKRKNTFINAILSALFFIVFLGAWQVIDFLLDINTVILPNPLEIFVSFIENCKEIIYHLMITSLEIIVGYLISIIVAVALVIVYVHFTRIKQITNPYVIALQATPVIVFAPLFVLWFGNGMLSKIMMAAAISFFPIFIGAMKGFTSIEQEFLDLFHSYSATKMQIFFKLRFPHSLPYLFPALKVSTRYAIVGAIVAEFTGSSQGIGHMIISASYYLDTSLIFANIVAISLMGIAFFYIVDYLEKRVVFWHRHE